MINKLLYRITKKLPCRLIQLETGPYLERYYLGKILGVTFYLHRFVSSDSERHVHNHPWGWGGSIILSGGYTEEVVLDICPEAGEHGCITKMVKRRWLNMVNGNLFHRIHDAKPGTWTLFFHGPRQCIGDWPADMKWLGLPRKPKGWGFLEKTGSSRGDVTVFVPYPSAHTAWWETAAPGWKSGRQPL